MSELELNFLLLFQKNSIGSCISRDEANSADNQLDSETSYSARNPSNPSAVYTQNVVIENSIEEFNHEAADHIVSDGREHRTNQVRVNVEPNNAAVASETFCVEIDRLSLANRKLSDQLQSVRHQLSDNLNRVRDFEERIKLIPKLQLELSVEKAENRDMHIKVRALENALKTKERNDISKTVESISPTTDEPLKTKPFNTQRVCATSLERLNIRFSNTSSPVESQKSHEAISNQPTSHNVGCMTTKSILRDVGIVTTPMVVDSKAVAVNTNISGRNPFENITEKPKTQNVYVQSECEPKVQTKNMATITDSEPVQKISTKSVGTSAQPSVTHSSCLARTETRSIGIDNIYQNTKTRTIGIDPIKEIIEQLSSKRNDSPISLKLLDNIQRTPIAVPEVEVPAEVKSKPKEFRTMGIQHSPCLSDKSSQCKEHVPESLPIIQSRTESTDTSDLTLLIHRAVNTEAPVSKKSRLTNTDRLLTDDKSTNTRNDLKTLKNSETNTDPFEISTKVRTDEKQNELASFSEHKCHNCLAKIEIKQRTIIKNPNKSHSIANIARSTTTTTTDHTSIEDLVQQTDAQTRIPRPTALISPRSDKKFTRQNTYTIQTEAPIAALYTADEPATPCPAEIYLS